MLENREYARKQIERLAGLDRFPRESKPALSELVDALMCAADDRAAKEFVDEWLANNREAPKPVEIRRLIFAEQERQESARKKTYCRECSGSGFVMVKRTVQPNPGMRYEADFAVACECRKVAVSA